MYIHDYVQFYLKYTFNFRPELLAVCADDSKVKVLDCTTSIPNLM